MTEVCYCSPGNDLMLCADGHATGSPETCNGLSALLYALRNWLWNTGLDKGWPEGAWTATIDKGRAVLRAPFTEETDMAFTFVQHGISLLEFAAPEALSLSCRCCHDCPHGRR